MSKRVVRRSGNRFACALGAASALIAFSVASAQNSVSRSLEVYEPATENTFPVGAKATGMGGAQIASGDDGSALYYNPALLTRIKSTEISGTLTQQRFSNKTTVFGGPTPEAVLNNTGLGSLWAIFPVPTEQGGLSLGLSVNRVRGFDRIFRYSSRPDYFDNPNLLGYGGGEDESGSLWDWSLGGAIEVSPQASVGLSIDIYDGHDDYAAFFDSTFIGGTYHYRHNINDSYTGVSGKIGAAYEATNWLNLGAVVRFPTSFTIDQNYSTEDNGSFDSGSDSYRYTLPFSFALGGAVDYADFELASDISFIDYSQLSYKRGFPDLTEADRLVREYNNSVLSFHLGAQYLIRPADVTLRAGYYSEPFAFQGYPVIQNPRFYTFGAGILIDKTANVDLAFVTGSWERQDPSIGSDENYSTQRFLATVSFRIK
jgi:long-chain fatty acid transport protein